RRRGAHARPRTAIPGGPDHAGLPGTGEQRGAGHLGQLHASGLDSRPGRGWLRARRALRNLTRLCRGRTDSGHDRGPLSTREDSVATMKQVIWMTAACAASGLLAASLTDRPVEIL